MIQRVAFAGKMCSGKDTASDFLVRKYGFHQLSFADPIRDIARAVYGDRWKVDGREFMQEVGRLGRRLDPMLWVNRVVAMVIAYPEVSYVINDVRFPNEVEALKRLNFLVIRINVSREKQIERLTARDGKPPHESVLADSSEVSLDQFNLPRLNGDLPKPEFYKEIERLIGVNQE